jgi:hypothetical protein
MENQNVQNVEAAVNETNENLQEQQTAEQEEYQIVEVNGEKVAVKPGSTEAEIARVKHLFGLNNMLDSVKKLNEQMKERQLHFLGDDESKIDHFTSILESKTIEEIKNASDEEIMDLFKTEDGGTIELVLDINNPEESFKFRRDFLIFMKESIDAQKVIDEETAKIEKEIAESREELNKLIEQFGDFETYIEETMAKRLEVATGKERERLLIVKQAYEEAENLNEIYEHYKNKGTLMIINTIEDLKSISRANRVYEKYKKQLIKLNIKTDLTDFDNLELKLDEKYHPYANVFLFAVIKYIAYKKDVSVNKDGVFLARLGENVRKLFADSFKDEAKKEKFKASISKVLDLFIQ